MQHLFFDIRTIATQILLAARMVKESHVIKVPMNWIIIFLLYFLFLFLWNIALLIINDLSKQIIIKSSCALVIINQKMNIHRTSL